MIPLLRKPLSHNHTHEALCALECLTRGVVATRRQKCGTTNKKGGKRGSGFLYAESDDGITWEKPNLGMTEFPPKSGNKNNNLLENDGMTTGIYLDESAPAAERYKITTGSNGAGAIAVSPDGIHGWLDKTKNLEKMTHARWDTPKNTVWDPVRKQWIIYLRAQPTEQSLRIQSYSHSTDADFMGEWSPATPTGLNTSLDYQPDGLVVWPYHLRDIIIMTRTLD
jgi:hypothetical protein